ncbi:MAG: cytochrome c3 family protein [Myxococcota bacterium]
MQKLPGVFLVSALAAGALAGPAIWATRAEADSATAETFTIGSKNLLPPELFADDLVVAVGEPPADPLPQPIAFPHDRHTKVLGMDCQYCHSGARKGIHAGIPATQVCMGCHGLVSTEGRPELDKLKEYYKDGTGEPIPWVKVHDLPDFVYFSHKRHVLGGVQCNECHGEVTEMTVAERVSSLKMGWCLDCHAQHEKIDENYGDKAELRRAELKDCWTCHK